MWVKGEIFRNLNEAAASAKDLDRAGQASPFDRFDWFERTMAHCAPPGVPMIARARAEGADAWLFLSEARGRAVSLSSWYTLAFRPIFTGDPSETVRAALLTAIARRLRKRLAVIALGPMHEADAELTARAFKRSGWRSSMRETSGNWTADLQGQSFAEYWNARPGELRSTVKRKGAKAGMDVVIVDRFDAAVWDDYAAVYAESWKPDEGSFAFLRDFAEAEGAAGTLRIGVGRIADEPVAAQLWTVERGTAIIHKLAHRESVAEFSPGTLLSHAMFARAIDVDRVARIDFGTGDDRYKRDWMDARAPLYTLELFNAAKPAGLFAAARALVASALKR